MGGQETGKRTALITGASRGIGAAIARAFAAQGVDCVINCSSERGQQEATVLANELEKSFGVAVEVVCADVSDFEQARQLVAVAKDTFGHLDVLVNNAGITRDGMLSRMCEDDFDRVIAVNLKGAFNCMRHASKVMVRQRYGRIVNVSSVVGQRGNAGQANYAASKAGILGLTKAAAKELAAWGITVNAVAPGFISTEMTDQLSAEQRESVRGRIALGEFGKPEDVACAVAFLASEEAGYITGQAIAVDGGLAI